jgi:hypothetical protein
MHIPGINFKKFSPFGDEQLMGIKREEFIEYLNSLEPDKNGWLNFKLTILPQTVKGFSCKLVHLLPKDVWEAKKAAKALEKK